jgi:hypothetical protein
LLSLNRRRPPRVWSRIGSGRPLPSVATAIGRHFRPFAHSPGSLAGVGASWVGRLLAVVTGRARSLDGGWLQKPDGGGPPWGAG